MALKQSRSHSRPISTITQPSNSLGGDGTDYSTGAPVAVESSVVTWRPNPTGPKVFGPKLLRTTRPRKFRGISLLVRREHLVVIPSSADFSGRIRHQWRTIAPRSLFACTRLQCIFLRFVKFQPGNKLILVAIYVDRKLWFWFSVEDLANIDISWCNKNSTCADLIRVSRIIQISLIYFIFNRIKINVRFIVINIDSRF